MFFNSLLRHSPRHVPEGNLIMRQGRGSEATEPHYAFRAKKPLHNEARPRERSDRGPFCAFRQKSLFIPGCAQGAIIYLVRLSVSVSVCNIRRFY